MDYRTIRTFLFDLLIPPTQEELRVRALSIPHLYTLLSPRSERHVEVLFKYAEPDIRTLLWQTKYKGDMRAAELLGTVVREVYFVPLRAGHLLIPIPLLASL